MILVEEQLIKTQNQLLEWQKAEANTAMKTAELIEKIDFLENLHNWEQERLYTIENECAILRQKEHTYLQELNTKPQNTIENTIENTSTKELLIIIGKRVLFKITGRK